MLRYRLLVLLTCLGLSLSACGGDDGSTVKNPSTNNGNEPDGGTTDPDGGDTDPDGGTTDPDGGDTDLDGGDTDPDGGDTDPDGGDTDPDTGPTFTAPEFYQQASGGGSVEGGGYRAVIGLGAPIPRGQVEGGGYRLRLGPVSP